jgi:outer membrane protein OmpA-like peptidoglycan-associated protein
MNGAIRIAAAAAAGVLGLAGCASTPDINADLAAAQAAVSEAKTDQRVVDHAPVQLQEAQRDLRKAEELASDRGGSDTIVSHYSYLATRGAQTATALGEKGAIEQQIAQTSKERESIRLQAREREVDQAKGQASMAKAEADEMAQRLAELQAEQTADRGIVLTLQDVLFDVGRAELQPGAQRTIDDLARFMSDYPDRRVRIEGFTDSTGSDEFNRQLSESRSFAVRDALARAGVSADRIDVRGYGEMYPVASNDSNEGRQLNRRVEILISDENGQIAAAR